MIDIEAYNYHLPEDKIAKFPVSPRHDSKLLVYKKGEIKHTQFKHIAAHIPENATLYFNETKVINARLKFKTEKGSDVEIFLLNPVEIHEKIESHLSRKGFDYWECMIGRKKKWDSSETLICKQDSVIIKATQIADSVVKLAWEPSEKTLSEILTQMGETPLPPYLKREAIASDKKDYQTVYSKNEGSVAAPTAGLHFTDQVFDSLEKKSVAIQKVTLHVGAGTFAPVKVKNAVEHPMHQEQIIVTRKNIENLLAENHFIIPVGTTSMRWLESVYWFGVILNSNPDSNLRVTQTTPVEHSAIDVRKALQNILEKMNRDNCEEIVGNTSIYIYPGYTFKLCKGIITNFHQPKSTLMLLISALVGHNWKKIYQSALENDYRFLSYGDSSLLIP
jgi:S-adenosylmethionine:tRNA ribosyltransferase-isomerase